MQWDGWSDVNSGIKEYQVDLYMVIKTDETTLRQDVELLQRQMVHYTEVGKLINIMLSNSNRAIQAVLLLPYTTVSEINVFDNLSTIFGYVSVYQCSFYHSDTIC